MITKSKDGTIAPHLTPANWYQLLKRATQLGHSSIWDFIATLR